jgi:hypothetical protein
MKHLREQKSLRGGAKREGGNGRDLTPKNMGALMPALKSRCQRQNEKVVAQRTQMISHDEG